LLARIAASSQAGLQGARPWFDRVCAESTLPLSCRENSRSAPTLGHKPEYHSFRRLLARIAASSQAGSRCVRPSYDRVCAETALPLNSRSAPTFGHRPGWYHYFRRLLARIAASSQAGPQCARPSYDRVCAETALPLNCRESCRSAPTFGHKPGYHSFRLLLARIAASPDTQLKRLELLVEELEDKQRGLDTQIAPVKEEIRAVDAPSASLAGVIGSCSADFGLPHLAGLHPTLAHVHIKVVHGHGRQLAAAPGLAACTDAAEASLTTCIEGVFATTPIPNDASFCQVATFSEAHFKCSVDHAFGCADLRALLNAMLSPELPEAPIDICGPDSKVEALAMPELRKASFRMWPRCSLRRAQRPLPTSCARRRS
jgi:hypothetical protein